MRLRVGLTGGIGSGKTAVAAILRDRGALVIDADALARDAVAPGTPGREAVFVRFPGVRAADGALNRAALAAVVFADPEARSALNAIVHPAVRTLAAALERAAPPDQVVVHEVPLLFETHFERSCDATVLVVAPVAARIARVVARSGLAQADVERRMAAQIDPERARALATFTIENDATPELLRGRVEGVWERILALPPRAAGTGET